MAQVILDGVLDTERAWQPATFAERGVSIPFTTPALTGARARRGARGLEVIVPQPAGAKGVYILAWAGLPDACTLTLHDLKLAGQIAAGAAMTPPAIRRLAGLAAAEGLAGRGARAAAQAAEHRVARSRLAMNAVLLEHLIVQMKGAPGTEADLQMRAKPCLNALAARLGRPAAGLLDDLRTITDLCVDHRFIKGAPSALDRRDTASVETLLASLRDLEGQRLHDGIGSAPGSAVQVAARRCRAMASEAAKTAGAALADVAGLLAAWPAARATFTATIGRPDWLLDGWQQLVLIWRLTEPGPAQQSCLTEMAMLIPPVPREAAGWPGDTGDDAAWARARRQVAAQAASLQTLSAVDAVTRNEKLRALAA